MGGLEIAYVCRKNGDMKRSVLNRKRDWIWTQLHQMDFRFRVPNQAAKLGAATQIAAVTAALNPFEKLFGWESPEGSVIQCSKVAGTEGQLAVCDRIKTSQANGGVGAYCESTPYKKLAKADPWAARLYHGVNVVERDDRIEYLLMSNERLQEGDVSAYPADAPRFDAQRQLYRDLALQEKLYVPGITETEKYHVEGYETKEPQGRLWHNKSGGMIPEW